MVMSQLNNSGSGSSKSHYTIFVSNPTDTISQALASAARSTRRTSTPTIKLEHRVGVSGNISQFLAKLWRLVNDEETSHRICWSEDGQSFVVRDQAKFSMELLPKYFKHHNFSSFVRQLNMYGFKKVANTEHGGLRCTRDDWQFCNRNFCRDRPELLELVKRKPSQPTHAGIHHHSAKSVDYSASLKKVVGEVNRLREDNNHIKNSFEKLKEENSKLFSEVESLNEKNKHQSFVIQKILHFLWRLVDKQNTLDYKQQTHMIKENGELDQQVQQTQYSESVLEPWSDEQAGTSQQGMSPNPPRSPSKYGVHVNKVENNLQSLQNLISQSFSFDPDYVNDLFEYNTDYVSPAVSPAPGRVSPHTDYNGSTPVSRSTSPARSPTHSPSFNVQVEQYPDERMTRNMNMSTPTYIQHPLSPHQQPHLSGSPIRSSHNLSPVASPHMQQQQQQQQGAPISSPARSPHTMVPHQVSSSPHITPVQSPHGSPYHPQNRLSPVPQQVSGEYVFPHRATSPLSHHSSVPCSPSGSVPGSPVNFHQQVPTPAAPHYQYKVSPGQYNPGEPPPRSYNQHDGCNERVVKKPKLSSYTQYLNWEEEEEEDDDESKIDPSSFFTKSNPS